MENQQQTEQIQGSVSEETVMMWKAKYRKILEVTVTDGEEKFAAYFCRPGMEVLSMIEKVRKTDEIKAASLLFDNCWLGGSEIIKEDAILKMAAVGSLNAMIVDCSIEVKNW